jgi:hypothetical protein
MLAYREIAPTSTRLLMPRRARQLCGVYRHSRAVGMAERTAVRRRQNMRDANPACLRGASQVMNAVSA